MRIDRISLPAALTVLAAMAGAACSGAGAGHAMLEAVADTVEGVTRLTYPESGAHELPWRLDTVTVVGGFAAGEQDYQFDQVQPGGVTGDDAGNLFVLDGGGSRVLGYEPAGAFRGAWGREGNGPGEIASPTGLGLAPDGTLWVSDPGNRRLTLLPTAGGAEPSSISFPEGAGSMGGELVPTADGAFGVISMFSFTPGDDTGPPPLPLVHITADGLYDDTLWVAERPHMDQVEARAGNMMVILLVQQAFAPGFHWERFSDGSFALADGPEYDIRLLAASGEERLRIRRNPPARTSTAEDMERERQRQRDMAPPGNIPGAEQLMEKRLEALTFAEIIPRITGLAVDTRDRLWVGVSVDTPGETERIDVYDRDGRLLGEIPAPEFFPLTFYGDGLAAELTADDLDVQQVVVYRLVEPASPDA